MTKIWLLPPGAVRLLLAALVMLSHTTRWQVGQAAVMLFFVLSGYWVSDLWLRRQQGRDPARFMLNRFLRIWPLYIVVAVTTAALLSREFGFSSLVLLGVASIAPRPIVVEWSLDIELQFYLLLPLLHHLASRLSPRACLALIGLATAAGWGLSAMLGIVTVLKFLPMFAVGMAVYRIGYAPSERTAAFSLAGFLGLTAILLMTEFGRGMLIKPFANPMNEQAFAMLWIAPLLPYLVASIRRRSGPVDRCMGDLSFPLYLVHLPLIQGLAFLHLGKPALFAIVAAVVGLAYVALDRPFERVRRHILEGEGRPATASA